MSAWMPDLSFNTVRMRQLTHKNKDFHWGHEKKKEFQEVKARMCSAGYIRHYDPSKRSLVLADTAKLLGTGFVLVQVDPEWKEGDSLLGCLIVWCGSLVAKKNWKNYSPIETEMAKFLAAVRVLHFYLRGDKVTFVTVHAPLKQIFSYQLQDLSQRLFKM